MRLNRYIGFLLAALVLVGCGVKKNAATNYPISAASEPEVPAWHTCLIQNARATVITDNDRLTANVCIHKICQGDRCSC